MCVTGLHSSLLLFLHLSHATHLHEAWSEECDPWKAERPVVATDYTNCPVERQSPSGCGDFAGDPRNETCSERKSFTRGCSRRFMHFMPEPDTDLPEDHVVPLNRSHVHVCVDSEIEYPAQRMALPVLAGQHRERWAKWGEYDYLPMTRWVHNIEHGTVAFLYNICLAEEDLCLLRSYIQSLVDTMGDEMGPFRWVLTPAPLHRLNSGSQDRLLGVAVWGKAYLTDCWSPADMDHFIHTNYRWTTPEDFPLPGVYSHLFKDKSVGDAQCQGKGERFSREATDQGALTTAAVERATAALILASLSCVGFLGLFLVSLSSHCRTRQDPASSKPVRLHSAHRVVL